MFTSAVHRSGSAVAAHPGRRVRSRRQRAAGLLITSIAATTLAVAAPLQIAQVDAAPGPMHAVALNRLLGFSVNTVNESGEMIGAQYDAGLYHAYRATTSGTVELTAPAGSLGIWPQVLTDNGTVVAQVFYPTEYGAAVYPAGSITPTSIPSLGGNSVFPSGTNDAGMVVGSATTATGESHAFFFDGTSMIDLGGPAGGSTNAQFLDASGAVIYGTTSTEAGITTVTRWTNGVAEDLGGVGGSFASVSAVGPGGHAIGYGETATGRRAFVVEGAGLTELTGLDGPNNQAFAVAADGTIVGTSRTAAGRDRAVLWTSPSNPVDLGTLGGEEAIANGIDAAGRIIGYSALASGPLFSDNRTHGFVIEGGVMHDVNDLLPAGSVEVTALYGITDSGYLLGDSRGGQVLLVPGVAPAPAYDLIDLTPGIVGESQPLGLNESGDVVLASNNQVYRWRLGTLEPVAQGVSGSISETGSVAGWGYVAGSQRGFRWDGPTNPTVDLGAGARPSDINASGDVVGVRQVGNTGNAFWYRNGTMVDLHALLPASTYSEARSINDAGYVSGVFQIENGWYRGFIAHGSDIEVVEPLGGAMAFVAEVNSAGVATGTASTATGPDNAFRRIAGVSENISPPDSARSEGIAINESGWVAGSYVSDATPGVYRPFIYDGATYRYSTGLGGDFASVMDLSDNGVAVGYGTTAGGASIRPLLFDGTTTTDLSRMIDPGVAYELQIATSINNAGWILARATVLTDQGTRDRAVLLVPHGGPDWLPPSISITTPADGAEYTVGSSVVVDYACTDNVEVVSCTANLADGAPLPTSLPIRYALDVTAVDSSGLTTTRRSTYLVVDPVPPTVSIVTPADGATYPLLSRATADYSCADNVVVNTCGGSLPVGTPISPSAAGPTEFSASAIDSSGHVTVATSTYLVSDTLETGLGLEGSFTSPGVPFSVLDAPAPLGVTVYVAGGGTAPATMDVCGGFQVSLVPGTQATLTCGSLEAIVAGGEVTVTTPSGAVEMIVPAGGSGVLNADGTAVDLGGTPITVLGPLTALVLSPPSAVVGTNIAQAFAVRGIDAQGHDLGDLTSSATFSISPTGTCTGATCRATTVGSRTVTARVGSATGTATLDVRTRQTITFTAITTKTMLQTPVTAIATASSGLPVSFTSTTPAVCTTGGTNGATITLESAGSCSIRADQSGDATFGPAVAVVRTFTVNRANQTITFTTPAPATIDRSPVVVTATASSGLPVTFTTTTPAVCTSGGPDGATITLLDAGTCTVRASQNGNGTFNAAVAVSRNFTVTKLTNVITFPTQAGRSLAQSPVTVSATATSGLPVQFTTTTPAVCTAAGTNGETITLLTAGTCTVRAEQPGDATYRAATAVNRSFTVSRVAQTISFPALAAAPLTQQTVTATATATSGLPVQFTTTTPAVCTAAGTNGETITLLTAGTCTVRAQQPGDGYWNTAPAVNRNFTVVPPPPAVTSLGVTPTVLASAGGAVQLNAAVSNATTCRFAVTPALVGFPVTIPCAGGSATAAATLPANTLATSRTYSFTVAAIRAGAPTATSSPVAVRVAPASESIVDLHVAGTTDHDPAFAGVPMATTIDVQNTGPNAATTATFTATLPAGSVLLAATVSTGGACSEAGGIVSCSLGTLASGASATVTMRSRPSTTGTNTTALQVASAGTELSPADNDLALQTAVVESSIVYSDDQTSTIYRLDPFGSPVAITSQPGSKSEPVLSPDKRTVAYSRFDPTTSAWQLWLVGIDGTNEHLVTDLGSSNLVRPSWSPDSSTIAFSIVSGGQFRAMLADVNGPPNVRRLIADEGVGEMSPTFTPDGASILFRDTCARPAPGSCRYHRVSASGAGTATPYEAYPIGLGLVVDPSATWFYFADQSGNIRRGRLDGSAHELVASSLGGGMTYWSLSPTGTRLAYTELVFGKNVISIIDVDGQHHQQLTTPYNLPDPAGCYSPVWSRDESQVVMHCYAGGAIFIGSASTSVTTPVPATGIGGSFRSRNAEWWGGRPSH